VHAGHRHLAPVATAQLAASLSWEGALTARERQLIALLAKGRTNKQIAVKLGLAPSTIKGHMRGVLMKLNARDRNEAVSVAIECGLLKKRETAPAVRRQVTRDAASARGSSRPGAS